MNSLLCLLQPSVSCNGFGEEQTVYTQTATVHAERVRLSGSRSEQVGEHFPDYRAEWNIRSTHHVEENWRAQHVGGHLYTVVAIIPNAQRRMQTLVCERVNE